MKFCPLIWCPQGTTTTSKGTWGQKWAASVNNFWGYIISDNIMLLVGVKQKKNPVTFHLKYPLGCDIHCLTLALSIIQKYSKLSVTISIYLQKHLQILNNQDSNKFCVRAKPFWVKYVNLHCVLLPFCSICNKFKYYFLNTCQVTHNWAINNQRKVWYYGASILRMSQTTTEPSLHITSLTFASWQLFYQC